MVAYTVAAHFGFPTDEFSLSYLASWTQGRDLRDKEDLLHEVHQTSGHFIREIYTSLEQGQVLEREASPLKMIEYIEQTAQITEPELPLADRLERIIQHSPEDVGVYLTSIAKQDTQQDLSSFEGSSMGQQTSLNHSRKPMTVTLMSTKQSPTHSSSRAKNRSANTSASSMMQWDPTITF